MNFRKPSKSCSCELHHPLHADAPPAALVVVAASDGSNENMGDGGVGLIFSILLMPLVTVSTSVSPELAMTETERKKPSAANTAAGTNKRLTGP